MFWRVCICTFSSEIAVSAMAQWQCARLETEGMRVRASLALCPWASHINPRLVVVQPKKTRPDITEKVLNQIKQINKNFCQCDQCSDILLRLHSIKLILLFLDRNICCGYSKEPSQWDSYLEHQRMFKQVDNILLSKNCLSKPACSGWTTIETLNDPFLGLCLMYAAKPL